MKSICNHEFENSNCKKCGIKKVIWTAIFGPMEYKEDMYVYEEQYTIAMENTMRQCKVCKEQGKSICDEYKEKIPARQNKTECKLCKKSSEVAEKMAGIVIVYNDKPILWPVKHYRDQAKKLELDAPKISKYYKNKAEKYDNEVESYERGYMIICDECFEDNRDIIIPVGQYKKWH